MTKIFLTLTYLALTFGQAASAAETKNLDLYHSLIESERDGNGKLIQLVLKPKSSVNSDPLTSTSTDIVLVLQNRLQQWTRQSMMTTENTQSLTRAGWSPDDIKNFSDAKNILSSTQKVQTVLGNKIVNQILREFQKDVNLIFQYNVLAKPGVPGYFHDRALIDKALKKALGAAENALGNTPALRAVTFLLNMSLGWVEEKRSYSQNVLLFYVEKFQPSDLGFTAEEVSFIQSSVFEREIPLWDFKKLAEAKKDWAHFGPEKFARLISSNSERLQKYGPSHGQILPNFDFAFAPTVKNNVSFILNSQDTKSKLSSDLSVAYDGTAPHHIRDFRIELQLIQLASSFLPVPHFVLSQLNGLIGSYYSSQKVTEGALFADLVSQGKPEQAQIVLEQSINPILIHDLK